jgi:GH18 family chitinase
MYLSSLFNPSHRTRWEGVLMLTARLLSKCFLWLFLPLISCNGALAQSLIVGYLQNRSDLEECLDRIDLSKLTHLNLAFVNPVNDDGDLPFPKAFEQVIDKAHVLRVKVLISICGGSASTNPEMKARYFRLIDKEHREAFCGKLLRYVKEHNFDGLDVDLEGPAINTDYGPFVHLLSEKFKADSKLLSAALSKGYGGKEVPDSALQCLDLVNIMSYDARGPWQPNNAGQHSSLEFAKQDVAYWLARGLPKSKAILGVPFYGYGFGDAFSKGGYAYRTLLAKYPEAASAEQVGKTIWYNGPPLLKAKAQWTREQGLGGIMIWSLDQDASGAESLLTAIHTALAVDK